MQKYYWFFALFYLPLIAGFLLRRFQRLSPGIMRWTILIVETPLFFISYWAMDWSRLWHFAPVPFFSLLLVLLPLIWVPGWVARWLPERRSQGSFVLAAAFSNIGGTGGAFLCYLLFGIQGMALGYLYLLPYPWLIFIVGFSLARMYAGAPPSWPETLRGLVSNPISLLPLLGMGLGAAMPAWGRPLPRWAPQLADMLIRLDLGVMCLAIGMLIRPGHLFVAGRILLRLGMVKFLLVPLAAVAGVWLVYGGMNSLPAKIILVQACMPPAIYSVVTANVFGLDRELAGSLWLAGSLMLIPLVIGLMLL